MVHVWLAIIVLSSAWAQEWQCALVGTKQTMPYICITYSILINNTCNHKNQLNKIICYRSFQCPTTTNYNLCYLAQVTKCLNSLWSCDRFHCFQQSSIAYSPMTENAVSLLESQSRSRCSGKPLPSTKIQSISSKLNLSGSTLGKLNWLRNYQTDILN